MSIIVTSLIYFMTCFVSIEVGLIWLSFFPTTALFQRTLSFYVITHILSHFVVYYAYFLSLTLDVLLVILKQLGSILDLIDSTNLILMLLRGSPDFNWRTYKSYLMLGFQRHILCGCSYQVSYCLRIILWSIPDFCFIVNHREAYFNILISWLAVCNCQSVFVMGQRDVTMDDFVDSLHYSSSFAVQCLVYSLLNQQKNCSVLCTGSDLSVRCWKLQFV